MRDLLDVIVSGNNRSGGGSTGYCYPLTDIQGQSSRPQIRIRSRIDSQPVDTQRSCGSVTARRHCVPFSKEVSRLLYIPIISHKHLLRQNTLAVSCLRRSIDRGVNNPLIRCEIRFGVDIRRVVIVVDLFVGEFSASSILTEYILGCLSVQISSIPGIKVDKPTSVHPQQATLSVSNLLERRKY